MFLSNIIGFPAMFGDPIRIIPTLGTLGPSEGAGSGKAARCFISQADIVPGSLQYVPPVEL